jgi:hypothetical protein
MSENNWARLARVKLPSALWQNGWLKNKSLPEHRMLMFHFGRSGSTVLADLLDQNPEVTWQGEYIRKFYAPLDRRGLEKVHLPVDADRLLLDVMAGTPTPYFGCEAKFFHLEQLGISLPAYLESLHRQKFTHFIVLERKNYIRKIASSLVARKRRRYRQPPDAPAELTKIAIHPHRVRIDRTALPLVELLESYSRGFEELQTLLKGSNVLNMTYEDDLLKDPAAGYQKACAYWGLTPVPVKVHYGRSNPFPLEAVIKNYDEVVAALKGTRYEWMMTDATGN